MIPKIFADISIADPVLGISSIITLLLSLVFIFLSGLRAKQFKPGPSVIFALISLILLGAATIAFLIAINIDTYQSLDHESAIAEIHFSRLGGHLYSAEIKMAGEDKARRFELRGDEWQLSARVIKWKTPLTILGIDSLYSLERLQGRYRDIVLERSAPRSVYALRRDSRLDLWSIIHQFENYLP
jgi:hypothetical protein